MRSAILAITAWLLFAEPALADPPAGLTRQELRTAEFRRLADAYLSPALAAEVVGVLPGDHTYELVFYSPAKPSASGGVCEAMFTKVDLKWVEGRNDVDLNNPRYAPGRTSREPRYGLGVGDCASANPSDQFFPARGAEELDFVARILRSMAKVGQSAEPLAPPAFECGPRVVDCAFLQTLLASASFGRLQSFRRHDCFGNYLTEAGICYSVGLYRNDDRSGYFSTLEAVVHAEGQLIVLDRVSLPPPPAF